MRAVGREVVPEMLEIGPFAPRDELERRLAVKVKVPEVLEQPDALPITDARQERIHEYNAIDLAWILRGVRIRDHEPDIMAGQSYVLESEGRGERVNVPRQRLLFVAIVGPRRLTAAAQVRCNDRVGLREFGDEREPHVACLREAVEEHNWIATTGDQIVQPGPVHIYEAASHVHGRPRR